MTYIREQYSLARTPHPHENAFRLIVDVVEGYARLEKQGLVMLRQACEGAVAKQVEDARQVRCIEPDVIVRFGQGKVEMFNGLVEGATLRQTVR